MTRLLLPAKVLFVLLVGFTVWQGWVFLRPSPREYSEAENAAIDKLCRYACERIQQGLAVSSTNQEPRTVGVAHFLGDPTDGFTEIMRDAVASTPGWRLEETSIIQRFLADVSGAVKDATSLDEIVHAGRRVRLDVVIAGRVLQTNEEGEQSSAEAAFIAHDVRRGETVLDETLGATWRPSIGSKVREAVQDTNPLVRILVWLATVLLLPIVTPFCTHWAVAKKSNWASFGVLALYTSTGLFLGLLLTGVRVEGSLRAALLCVAVLLLSVYNFWTCERIAR